ncbi:patatin-like phospholipase family protein [Noviherbaspirillum massiliense]|uniref:patatin-like phospholipase family protein n=1 Tax=Noviherbaspirillum massiliense TaxID=1465823 RepID=UPI0002FCF471|nr:patatin-like phospholipase family protein [Noviherbaspirillum massiliense]
MSIMLRLSFVSALVVSVALAACATVTPVAPTSSAVTAQQAVVQTVPVAPVVVPPEVLPKAPRNIKIGLALGGGAARGFAHIGVIKALEAQGIYPDIVVGTSAGSLVGALYAAGNNGFALHKLALQMDEAAISDWSIPFFAKASGVLKGEALQNYVNRTLHNVPLEKLKIPFGAVATDLHTGAPILFRRGNTGVAVRASSAVPSVFQPVKIGSHTYVDGGLVSPVPVRFAREMGADFVIAVNISAQPEMQPSDSSFDVLLQTFAIMGKSINQYELKDADIVLQPKLGSMKGNDFPSRNLAILAGEQVASAAIPEIKQKLKAKREQ